MAGALATYQMVRYSWVSTRTRCLTFAIMPRTAGVSSTSRLRCSLFSPSPTSVARWSFGRPIGRHQAVRHKIAEMAVKAETGRALTYHALRLFHAGEDAIREVTQAKLFTQRAAFEVADDAIQVFGGAGYMREYEVERAARDLRLGPIGGGTDEIMKEILGKQMGL